MYPVSEAYKMAIADDIRTFALELTVETAFETFVLDETDIVEKTLTFDEGVSEGSAFSIGYAYKSDFAVALRNTDGRFDEVQLNGALLRPRIGLKLPGDAYEWVPLGVFVVDTVNAQPAQYGQNSKIGIKAFDLMGKFERPFTDVALAYPISAGNLLTLICQRCGVPLKSADFLHRDYTIAAAPEGLSTCRDAVSAVAELAGSWARIDRAGMLEIGWFDNPTPIQDVNLDGNTDTADGGTFTGQPAKSYDGGLFAVDSPVAQYAATRRKTFTVDDAPIIITGVKIERDDGNILAGSAKRAITITDNPLIQHDADAVALAIWDKLQNFSFLPYSSTWYGDPAVQAGDMIVQVDRRGNAYRTIITESRYALNRDCTIKGGGKSDAAAGSVDAVTRAVSKLTSKISQKQAQINALDQALANGMKMLIAAMGGNLIDGATVGHPGEAFIADSADVATAQKIWRYNLNGWGYSSTGIDGPYTIGATADNSLWANLITAAMIQTGLLKSLATYTDSDGAVHPVSQLDMDTGAFSFAKGALVFDGEKFKAVAAEKLTDPEGDGTYATIGKSPDGEGGYGLSVVSSRDNVFFRAVAPAPSGGVLTELWASAPLAVVHKFTSTLNNVEYGYLAAWDTGTVLSSPGVSGGRSSIGVYDDGIHFTANGMAFGASGDIAGAHYENGLCTGPV